VTFGFINRAVTPPGVPPPPPTSVLTGSDGGYSAGPLAPGEYRINVLKPGLAEGLQSVQQMPTVVVTAGRTTQSPDVFLDRGGAIAGRILDGNGEPMVDARVMALAPAPVPPQLAARGYRPPPDRRMVPAGHAAQTNDLGEFRIYGLFPGDYVVAATGESNLMVRSTSPTTVTTTYYPGVTDQTGAQTINVTAGQTASGVEIRMATAPAFLISGVVVDTDGRPLEGAVVSVTAGSVTGPHAMSYADAQGRFLVGGMTSGTYHVGVASSNSGPGATMRLPQQITVTVADGNVSGVRLVLVPK
jgi:protocatechuate 3,4-dioxygenase beta subunit